MGRALSLSLAGHLTLILSFLLLSATRQPLRIPEIVRPVRLVTYLETTTPARSRVPRPVESAPAPPSAPSRVAPPEPAPAAARPTAPEPPVAAAVTKIVIPTRPFAPATPPAPAPATRPVPAAEASLRDRLSRRLAAAAPAETHPPDATAPQIAALAPPESVPEPQRGAPAAAATTGGSVLPIGNFPHAWYLTLLKESVFGRWSPPSEFYTGGRAPVALVSFRVDRAGRIDRVALKESSGAARFDESALAAVQSLGRAPALPETYGEETLDVVIRFQNIK